MDRQNPEFKSLDRHNPELKILDCQNSEFKILAVYNPEFRILAVQNPEFKILEGKIMNSIFWKAKRGTGADKTQDRQNSRWRMARVCV